MLQINKLQNETFIDCYPYSYEFLIDNVKIVFEQSGNRDLYFLCYCNNYIKEITLSINNDDYILYTLLQNLYNEIIELQQKDYNKFTKNLINRNYLSLESDDIASPLDNDIKFNYLNIQKYENEFIIKFINNSKRKNFSIALNTDRSKYKNLIGPFMSLLRNLEKATEEFHQITLDEYENIKILKK